MTEAFETLGLDQLLEDGDLAFLGEGDFLVTAFNAFLHPGLFGRVGDVHVLDADIAAIGAAHNGEDFPECSRFQTQHAINEDAAVHVGFSEAPVAWMQFGVIALGLEAQRIEVRLQVAADTEGADQHQGTDRIARGGLQISRRHAGGLGGDSLFDLGLHSGPDAIHGGHQFVTRRYDRRRPAADIGVGADRFGPVHEGIEEGAPFGRHRIGVLRPALLHLLDEDRVGAVEKRGLGKDLIEPTAVVCHFASCSDGQLRHRLPFEICLVSNHP